MTIAIGMICKESIVLASDSQASFAGTSHKRTDAEKLVAFDFSGTGAVVMMAGGLMFFDSLCEKIANRAKSTEVKSERTIADAVQAAVRSLKQELVEQAIEDHRKAERWEQMYADYGCELAVAYYFDGKPCLYHIHFATGLAVPVRKPVFSMGCASDLADFILHESNVDAMPTTQAMAVAAYVVQMAKEHDRDCGGPTQIGLVYPRAASVLDRGETIPFVEVAKQFEEGRRAGWAKSLGTLVPEGFKFIY